MKKSIIVTLALVFVLGIAGTSFAASNPFVDVPANHWAYKAVADLQKRGLVDGYGDGTFKGDKVMSRYEMATVVAKAMANVDKADAATKAQLDKLQAEFATELQNLGVKVDAVNAKVDNMIKFTGDARIRYQKNYALQGTDNGGQDGTRFQERVRFTVKQKVNDNWTATVRFGAQNNSGRDNWGTNGIKNSAFGDFQFDLMEFAYKNNNWFGSIGRSNVTLGQGLISDTPGIDMMMLGYQNGNFKMRTMYGDVSPAQNLWARAGAETRTATQNVFMADATYQFPSVQISAAYLKNVTTSYKYKQYAFGANAQLGKDFGLQLEYVKNNNGDLPDSAQKTAFWANLTYKGADMSKPQSYGISLNYKKIGADAIDGALTTLNVMDNTYGVKGWGLGFDYVLAKNLQFSSWVEQVSPYDKGRNNFNFHTAWSFALLYKF